MNSYCACLKRVGRRGRERVRCGRSHRLSSGFLSIAMATLLATSDEGTICRGQGVFHHDEFVGPPVLSEFGAMTDVAAAIRERVLAPIPDGAARRSPHQPQRLLVRFKPHRAAAAKTAAHRAAADAEVLKEYHLVPELTLVKVPPARLAEALKSYAADPNVMYAEPDVEVHIAADPNDADFGLLWGMRNTGQAVDGDPGTPGADIRATYAWDLWTGDPNFRIAVIDTGVNYNHSDLAANIWTNPGEIPGNGIDDDDNGWVDDVHGYDFYNDDGDPADDHYHGSHVAGTIGAVANNGAGVAGVNWHCKIVALKILGSTGSGSISSAVDAMQYVVDNNISVSNNSWGWPGGISGTSQALYDAIEAAQAVNHIFVAAAGNFFFGIDNDQGPHFPASFDLPNIISVSATDNDDALATFSNYGLTTVDVGAPGVKIYSTRLGTDYGFLNGTSMASPHTAGLVALVWSQNPQWTWQRVRDWILLTARPVDSLRGKTVSGAVIDAAAAVGDCNLNGTPDWQELSAGTSADCNDNGYPDECELDCNDNLVQDSCDIISGSSADCNANGIPDDCEPDCNANALQDDCDIQLGASDDCNANGVPDECETGWDQDCNGNTSPDLCDIHNGTSPDCQHNAVPDECEIASGVSPDCTTNGVPDECERDCNENGIADSCDIVDGTSLDADGDGAPDECTIGLRFIPKGATGPHTIVEDEIFLDSGGQSVTFEVYLSGWDLDQNEDPLLAAYQVTLDVSHFIGDLGGNLSFAQIPCVTNGDCFHSGYQNSECLSEGFCDFFSSVYVDESHPDFPFSGFRAFSVSNMLVYWFGSVIFDPDVGVADTGGAKYLGTVILDVSTDAEGLFEIGPILGDVTTALKAPDQTRIPIPGIYPALIILPSDCNGNGIPDATDIADGTSIDCDGSHLPDECETDCNSNGIADSCDVTGGASEDCTGNGLPDECEPDCNGNGVPDSCDTLAGTSPDCSGNEIPDECEADCNENGTADSCDVVDGTSPDVNGNEMPDECELPILFVDHRATGANNGLSWEDAFTDLQTALTVTDASVGTPVEIEEIWVARGTYRPTKRSENLEFDPRTVSFILDFPIRLYGGFAGGESSRNERNVAAHPTILSGDLFGNDGPDFTNNSENARHVVTTGFVDSSTLLDGFTITGGNANGGPFYPMGFGGGLLNQGSATVRNCTIIGNSAEQGGGVYDWTNEAAFINCRFLGNNANDKGGGAYIQLGSSTFTNCVFSGNVSAGNGGAMFGIGTTQSPVRLTNSTFVGNHADVYGGAVSVTAMISMSNCVIWGNTAGFVTGEPAQLHLPIDPPDINYSIVQGWTGTIGGVGNSGDDPRLLDSHGPDGIAGTLDDDPRVAYGSPCIDSGDSDAIPPDTTDVDGDGDTVEPTPVDIDGNPRVNDDLFTNNTGAGTQPFVDRGAHEFGPDCNGNGKTDDQDIVEGTSDDCNANGRPDECEPDCNGNGVADECDITDPTSDDCTANGIPDECEPDCNGNGAADSCDINDGTSADIDGTGIPDECEAPVLYVKADASGSNTGLTWENAFADLQDALAAARAGNRVEQIWVAAGVYTPTSPGGSRWASFALINGVALSGGFAGWETDAGQRDRTTNETVLSGEIDGDNEWSNNSFHVVTGHGTDSTAVLDGFTITGGYDYSASDPGDRKGAGIYNLSGSPTIRKCTLTGNRAAYGSGMFNDASSSPTIIDCVFSHNHGGQGGGIYNHGNPVLVNCVFLDNTSGNAGGVYNYGNLSLINNVFSGNEATVWAGGAILNISNGTVSLVNCTLMGNHAVVQGGTIYDEGLGITVDNCILWDNSDAGGSGESAQVLVSGTGAAVVNYSHIQGWTGGFGGVGNSGDDPLIVDADGADDVYGTDDDDLRLAYGSPCIDAGDNSTVPADEFDIDGDSDRTESVPLDADRTPRFLDEPFTIDAGSGSAPIVDVGAYEYGADCNGNGIPDDQDIADGASEDCADNGIPDECEPDCNGNTFPDSCDIAVGTSPDCNTNGIPDSCDIDSGRSGDCNDSLVPDECEPDDDGDGTINVCDACPADPNKTDPGACGCGTSDGDSDGDTVADCLDVCDPFDDLQDADGDGVPDGCDLCPGSDDSLDADGDAVPDGCDICSGFNDAHDADGDGVPDGCDQCPGFDDTADCNINTLPDACDIQTGASNDTNGNGIPDECEPPLLAAEGCRHLSITPLAAPDPVALLMTSPDYPCLLHYITPAGHLSDGPVFLPPSEWGTVTLTTWIAAERTYTVQSDNGSLLSSPSSVTLPRWGDAVGAFVDGAWEPPNGSVEIIDAVACLDRFRGLPTAPPVPWCDLDPVIPNGTIDITDIVQILDAFGGSGYHWEEPCQ